MMNHFPSQHSGAFLKQTSGSQRGKININNKTPTLFESQRLKNRKESKTTFLRDVSVKFC